MGSRLGRPIVKKPRRASRNSGRGVQDQRWPSLYCTEDCGFLPSKKARNLCTRRDGARKLCIVLFDPVSHRAQCIVDPESWFVAWLCEKHSRSQLDEQVRPLPWYHPPLPSRKRHGRQRNRHHNSCKGSTLSFYLLYSNAPYDLSPYAIAHF